MSTKTVDERVVSMQFDNRQFERNVQTSMSTLDKLKAKLSFKDSGKSLENLSGQIKKVDMSGFGKAIDVVSNKFSALEIMGITALANITNSAVNAGKRMVSALTIDPVKAGLQEYETQINSVQTILANTQSKGSTIDDVNNALKELNDYADLTIYNFTEMTRNIGTFTAAGVDLDTSVNAIKGIANLAAVSGSTSQQASTAMYQLSQALASGTVKLMDWNSVVNAGMGGQVFQDALKETARAHGIAIDSMIESQGSFRETLSDGWLTSEILTDTLQKFTLTTEGLTDAQIEANREMLKSKGYTEEQIEEIFKLGNTATEAATKVKTFTQLWDVLKEAAQSGWSQTWQLIIGDYEEAKALFSPLADLLTGFIGKMSKARNDLLEGALGKSFKHITELFTGIAKPIQTVASSIEDTVEVITDLGAIVDDVILGKFGEGESRFSALTEAGYNYCEIQNKVNEKLGDSFRFTEEQIAAQNDLLGVQTKVLEIQNGVVEVSEEQVEAQEQLTEADKARIKELSKMSDEELRALDNGEKLVEAFKELRDTSDKLGLPLEELIDNLDVLDGRWILINSFKNIGNSIITVFKAMGEAWRSIFPPMQSEQLFNIIAGIHKLTSNLVISEDTANNLMRTFRGLFAIIDIITTFIGGGFKIAFKVINTILGYFDMNILEVTGNIGDALVAFRDWIDANNIFAKGLEIIIPYIKKAVEAVSNWIDGIKSADNIPKYIIEGLVNGLKNGITAVGEAILSLAKHLVTTFKDFLGIHSPSLVFYEAGVFIIDGLVNGLKEGIVRIKDIMVKLAKTVKEAFVGNGSSGSGGEGGSLAATIFNGIVDVFKGVFGAVVSLLKNLDFGSILAVAIGAGMVATVYKIVDVIGKVVTPLVNLSETIAGIGNAIEKHINAKAFAKKAQGLLSIAKAIAVISVSLVLLASLNAKDLLKASLALLVITGALVALSLAAGKIGEMDIKFSFSKASLGIVGIATSLLLMAVTMKQLSDIDMGRIPNIAATLGLAVAAIAAVLFTFGIFMQNDNAQYIDKAGKMMKKMSVALLLMVGVIKLASMIDGSDAAKGIAIVAAIEALFAAIVGVSAIAGKNANDAGKMIKKMATAMLLMVAVIKLASGINDDDLGRGLAVVKMLEKMFLAMIAVSFIAGNNAAKAGSMLLMMSMAMLIMVGVINQASKLDEKGIDTGIGVVITLGVLFTALIAVTKLAGKHAVKAGAMLLMMSGAMVILTGVLFILSKMDPSGVARALGVIVILETLFIGLIAVTSIAKDCKTTLILMIVTIGLLTAAVIGLSFIDPSKLQSATTAMGILMTSFALLVASTKLAGKVDPKTLAGLLLVVGGLALILGLLTGFDIQPSIQVVGSLSILLISMAASMKLISGMNGDAFKAVGAMALLGLVVGEIGLILGLITKFNIAPSLSTVSAISILLIGMSVACVILSKVGATGTAAITGAAALSGVALLIAGLIGTIGYVTGLLPESTYNTISQGLDRFTELVNKVAYGVGAAIGNFVAGLFDGLPEFAATLGEFMEELQPFLTAVSAIDESTLTAGKNLASMILTLTAANLLESISSFLTGSSSLTDFAAQLKPFGEAMVEFSDVVDGNIKEEAVTAAASAGQIMSELADSIPKSGGWAQGIMGEQDLGKFGSQIVAYGEAVVAFSDSLKDVTIDLDAAEKARDLGVIISAVSENIPKSGGWAQSIMGEADLSVFGKQMVAYAGAVKDFNDSLKNVTIDLDAAEKAKDLGVIIGAVSENIPKTGGWAQKIMGVADMGTFGEKMVAYAIAVKDFSGILYHANIDVQKGKDVADIGTALADMADNIPNSGGLFSFFSGDSGIDDFSDNIYPFGQAIKLFSDAVSGVDNTCTDGIQDMISDLYDACSDGKLLELMAFFSQDALPFDDFGTNAGSLGTAIKSFSDSINGVNATAATDAITVGTTMVDLINMLPKDGLFSTQMDITEFGADMVSFGESMTEFANEVSKIDTNTISAKVGVVKTITSALTTIGQNGVKDFKSQFTNSSASVTKAINSMIAGAINALNNKKTQFTTAGKTLQKAFTDGFTGDKSGITNSFTSTLSNSVTVIRTYYISFYNAGSYLVTGFVNGIKNNKYKVVDASKEMAKASKEAATKELDEHSPSKEFYCIGDNAGAGFVNALYDYASVAYNASSSMASSAKQGLSDAISKVRDILESDMDTTPVIRPVIDLSDVNSGIGTINSMLRLGSSLGVSTNIGTVHAMMSSRSQNGGNDDVVSAIDKLSRHLGNVGNTTYNVNGVTYDDGSNIAGAVRTLIRAATIEGRA